MNEIIIDQLVWGKKTALSPQPVNAKLKDHEVIVTFDQPLQEGEQAEFEVAGADKKFVNVKEATASGRQVSLKSPISDPVFVRYAWKDNPVNAHLYSKKDLPASPFEVKVTK